MKAISSVARPVFSRAFVSLPSCIMCLACFLDVFRAFDVGARDIASSTRDQICSVELSLHMRPLRGPCLSWLTRTNWVESWRVESTCIFPFSLSGRFGPLRLHSTFILPSPTSPPSNGNTLVLRFYRLGRLSDYQSWQNVSVGSAANFGPLVIY
jgi:hypothetical protein